MGLNKIDVNLFEDGGAFNDVFQVLKAIWGTTFGFNDKITYADDQHPAVYSFLFNVTDKCTAVYFDPSQMSTAKIMLFTNVNEAAFEDRIKKEEAAPEPLVILADGSSVTLSSVSLKFSSFI